MKKCSLLFALCLFYSINFCFAIVADSNLVVLSFDGKSLSLKTSYSKSGKVPTDVDKPIFCDYQKLRISIEGSERMELTKFKTFVYYMGKNCETPEKEASPSKSYTKAGDFTLADLTGLSKLDTITSRFTLVFVYNDKKQYICIEPAQIKAVDASVSSTPCLDPHFYFSYYLNVKLPQKDQRGFYVIEQDFSSINNGPQIFRYSSVQDGVTKNYSYQRNIKKALRVGFNATVVFKFFSPEYSKIENTLTFDDLNQEDRALFESFMKGSKGTKDTGIATPTVEKTMPTSATTNAYMKIATVLVSDLTLFKNDIYGLSPGSADVTSALNRVKENIKNCIPDLATVTPLNLLIVLRKGGENPEYLTIVDKAVELLYLIEEYSAHVPPSFQIKNADVLESTVNYYMNNESTPKYTRDFQMPILGGLKVDFSSGFIFSNLVDRAYIINDAQPIEKNVTGTDGEVTTQSVAMKRVSLEQQSKFKLGFGVLSHFYTRMYEWGSLAFTSGFIVKDDLAIQFPIGGSILIGRKPRLSLSSGLVIGERSELSSRYKLDTDVEATTFTNVTEDKLTVKRYKTGWFFAFTYNFGGVSIGK